MKRIANSQDGFSLIEVLVAFTILSLTVITGFQIFGDGLSRISRVDSAVNDITAARTSLMAAELGQKSDAAVTRTVLENETVDWTKNKPALLQVKRGDNIILETIVIVNE